jgi:hypothetical protein
MKLLEIFPDMPVLEINGKSYTLEYTMQSERELEKDYGSYEACLEVIKTAMDKMNTTDLINFLYAGLLHTDLFDVFTINKTHGLKQINRELAKEFLSKQLRRPMRSLYILTVSQAFLNTMLTPEQLEMMEVMAAQSQKKTEQADA